jgi:hypothetical protein
MTRLFTLLGASLLAVLCAPALAAELTVRTGDDGTRTFVLSGPLDRWNAVEFLAEMTNAPPDLVEVEGIAGDLVAAVRIGSMIDALDIDTYATGPCTDACAFVWLAGTKMIASGDATIEMDFLTAATAGDRGMHRNAALISWYFGRLALSVDMLDAYLALAGGAAPGGKLDLLAFVSARGAPVELMDEANTLLTRAVSGDETHCGIAPLDF